MGALQRTFGKVRQGALLKQNLPSRNADLVQWSSIDTIVTSGSNWVNGYTIANMYKRERASGSGVISQVKFQHTAKSSFTGIFIYIYRFNGTNYDKIYEEDVISKCADSNAINTVTLATPVNVLEGDIVACYATRVGGAVATVYGATKSANAIRYLTGAPANPEAWDSGTGSTLSAPKHLLGIAPLYVGMGDSIMEGYPAHQSMIDGSGNTNVPTTWEYKLQALDARFVYQNCGVAGETTTSIEARFARDVVAKKPKFAVINGGINDIALDGTKAVFLEKMTAMLDSCVTNSIIPIVWKMMPATGVNNTRMGYRDEWNADLVTLFNSYNIPGKILIDWDSVLGVFRAGGAAGNLWNLQPALTSDGTHLTEAGNALVASTMLTEIGKVFKL